LRGKADTRIDSDSGFRSAPPTPCSDRNAISWVSVVASAHAADAIVKIARPTRKMRCSSNGRRGVTGLLSRPWSSVISSLWAAISGG